MAFESKKMLGADDLRGASSIENISSICISARLPKKTCPVNPDRIEMKNKCNLSCLSANAQRILEETRKAEKQKSARHNTSLFGRTIL